MFFFAVKLQTLFFALPCFFKEDALQIILIAITIEMNWEVETYSSSDLARN